MGGGGGGGAPGSWGWDGVSPVQSECGLALSPRPAQCHKSIRAPTARHRHRHDPVSHAPATIESIHPSAEEHENEGMESGQAGSPCALVGYWFYGVVQQYSKLHWSAHTKVESISVHWQSICRSNLAQSGQARDTTQMELTSSGPSRRRGLVGES